MIPDGMKVNLYQEPPKNGQFERCDCPQCKVKGTALRSMKDGLVFLCPHCRKKNRRNLPKDKAPLSRRPRLTVQRDSQIAAGFPFFSLILWRVVGLQAFRIAYRKQDSDFGIKRFYLHFVFLWTHFIVEI